MHNYIKLNFKNKINQITILRIAPAPCPPPSTARNVSILKKRKSNYIKSMLNCRKNWEFDDDSASNITSLSASALSLSFVCHTNTHTTASEGRKRELLMIIECARIYTINVSYVCIYVKYIYTKCCSSFLCICVYIHIWIYIYIYRLDIRHTLLQLH